MKIVTLGEIMMRLTPHDHRRFVQADDYGANFGGSEANAAAALACFGEDAWFVTKLPANPIGDAAEAALKKTGVHTDCIVHGGSRLGLYFEEEACGSRPSQVVYDRAGSAIAQADLSDFDFDAIMKGKDWFHWSGITPAVSDKAAALTEKACQAAKRHGLKISCDLNYRSRLWTPQKAAGIMIPLMQYVDVVIANEADAVNCLNFSYDVTEADENVDMHEIQVLEAMRQHFHFDVAASAWRQGAHGLSDQSVQAVILKDGRTYLSHQYNIVPVVEKIGCGDTFTGGLIHGLLHFDDLQKTVEFGAAAAALKHSIPGDLPLLSEAEVLACVQKGGQGGMVR